MESSGSTATLTFSNATARTLCVGVVTLDDNAAESTETVIVTLTVVDTTDMIGFNRTTITIMDNDGEGVGVAWVTIAMWLL